MELFHRPVNMEKYNLLSAFFYILASQNEVECCSSSCCDGSLYFSAVVSISRDI